MGKTPRPRAIESFDTCLPALIAPASPNAVHSRTTSRIRTTTNRKRRMRGLRLSPVPSAGRRAMRRRATTTTTTKGEFEGPPVNSTIRIPLTDTRLRCCHDCIFERKTPKAPTKAPTTARRATSRFHRDARPLRPGARTLPAVPPRAWPPSRPPGGPARPPGPRASRGRARTATPPTRSTGAPGAVS